jgi:hypothetical protein
MKPTRIPQVFLRSLKIYVQNILETDHIFSKIFLILKMKKLENTYDDIHFSVADNIPN